MFACGGGIVETDGDGSPEDIDLVGVETCLGCLGDNEFAIIPGSEDTDLSNDLPAATRGEECLLFDCC